jgi:hypothetical protein
MKDKIRTLVLCLLPTLLIGGCATNRTESITRSQLIERLNTAPVYVFTQTPTVFEEWSGERRPGQEPLSGLFAYKMQDPMFFLLIETPRGMVASAKARNRGKEVQEQTAVADPTQELKDRFFDIAKSVPRTAGNLSNVSGYASVANLEDIGAEQNALFFAFRTSSVGLDCLGPKRCDCKRIRYEVVGALYDRERNLLWMERCTARDPGEPSAMREPSFWKTEASC